jgi:peptidoglycan/xylan/chitin deacetylase (PgdA/CDA1 family)
MCFINIADEFMQNKLLFKILRISGVPFLFREIVQRNKVTILVFHNIKKETAQSTFDYLLHNYNIIPLRHFIDVIEKREKGSIPRKAIIITFDDGNIDNFELLPTVIKTKIPITIFLCSSIVNTNRHFWYQHNPLTQSSFDEYRNMSNKERLERLSLQGFIQEKEYEKPHALQKNQIDEMKKYIDMQSHTKYHPFLPNCEDTESFQEISESRDLLEKIFGLDVYAIAYPNGDYSEREMLLVKEAGYKCGITVDFGFNTINTNAYRLKRISTNDTDNIDELIVRASGLWGFIKSITSPKKASEYKPDQ